MKNVHCVSTKQHEDIKSSVLRSKNSTFSQAWCASSHVVSCSNMWKSNCPHRHVNAIALHVFCGCICKTSRICHQWNQVFHHRSGIATDRTSWDLQACTHDTLCHQRYITTSNEYSISCHILFKYFELVFFQP